MLSLTHFYNLVILPFLYISPLIIIKLFFYTHLIHFHFPYSLIL
ncbi:MAG: hypothetical protein JWO58_58 [Chitinophagaceae bacterium]|nr:hypothetical protein [Chitinophagaceae bacterium]